MLSELKFMKFSEKEIEIKTDGTRKGGAIKKEAAGKRKTRIYLKRSRKLMNLELSLGLLHSGPRFG